MKLYFNHVYYDDMKKMQESYLQFIFGKDNPTSFHFKITEDNDKPILDITLPVNQNEKNLFNFIYKVLNKELIENIENIFYVKELEEYIQIIENCYVEWFMLKNEIEPSQIACLTVYSNDLCDYYEYPSSDELLHMANECALYDIENFDTDKTLEDLTEEYLNISTESLIDQYEKYYKIDYHATLLAYIGHSYKDEMIQRISLKRYETYNDVKKHYNINRKNLELSISKKKK